MPNSYFVLQNFLLESKFRKQVFYLDAYIHHCADGNAGVKHLQNSISTCVSDDMNILSFIAVNFKLASA